MNAKNTAPLSAVAAFSESFAGSYADADEAIAWTLAWPDYGETFAKLDRAAQQKYVDDARTAIDEAGDLSWRFAINFYAARRGEDEQPPAHPH